MTATARHHHVSHGNHPVSLIGYVALLAGVALAAIWLVTLGVGETLPNILASGLGALTCFLVAAAIFYGVAHRTHHSPLLPTDTDNERRAYYRNHPH